MPFTFITDEYEFSHGRTPRGRGSWAFSIHRNPDVMGNDILWSPSMTYADAKRWAKAEAAKRWPGCDGVWVLS
jgi:hypothetical protein